MSSLVMVRYAHALLGLAEERGTLDQTEVDLANVCQVIRQYPEISHLVLNSTISQPEKEDFIDKIIPQDISRLVVQFIKVLIRKRRFEELDAIRQEFHRLYEKKRNIQEVTVITAVPVSKANEERLKKVLKNKLGTEIRLIYDVHPNVIGGMILRFDHTEINGSYSGRLEELSRKLRI